MNLLDKTEINLHDEKKIKPIKRKPVINKNDDKNKNIKIDAKKSNVYRNLIILFFCKSWVIIVGIIALADCLGPNVLKGLIMFIGSP